MKTLNKILTVALLISIVIDVNDFVMELKKNYIVNEPRKKMIISSSRNGKKKIEGLV